MRLAFPGTFAHDFTRHRSSRRLSRENESTQERNDLYITLAGGKFSQDKKTAAKNVEVKMTVVLDNGSGLPCLKRGTGMQLQPSDNYRSSVYYHNNNPTFNELVHMAVPTGELFERAHLLFFISHTKDDKKTARSVGSFAFLPLTEENGAAIADGPHALPCYKLTKDMEKAVDKSLPIQPNYISHPEALTEHKITGLLSGSKNDCESLVVSTQLVSTKKTQVKDLHEIITWRQNDRILDTLKNVVRTQWSDIFKMLQEIMNALVELLNAKLNSKREALPAYFFFACKRYM